MQPQLSFVFLEFEAVSDKNTLGLSNEVLLSEITKSCKHQSQEGIDWFLKKTYIPSFFFNDKILKSSILN